MCKKKQNYRTKTFSTLYIILPEKVKQFYVFILITFLLSGCGLQEPRHDLTESVLSKIIEEGEKNNTPKKFKNFEPRKDMVDTLIPNVAEKVFANKSEKLHFDISVKDISPHKFFYNLSKKTTVNIVASHNLVGQITLNLKNVTIDKIMHIIHDKYNYNIKKESYGYMVSPLSYQTRIFNISYLNIPRSGTSETSISTEQISKNKNASAANIPSASITSNFKDYFWKNLKETLLTIIKSQESLYNINLSSKALTNNKTIRNLNKIQNSYVVVNPQAGLIIVRAQPKTIKLIKQYIDSLATSIHREVMIDAKIIEVTLNANYQSGIDWRILGMKQMGNEIVSNDIKPFSGIFSWKSSGDNLNAAIKLLSTQGRVNVLSSPRIATLNNQKALIKVGADDFYITGISSNVTSSSSTTTTQNVDLTPFFSGVALDVTPEIGLHNQIIMHIHPIISSVSEKNITFNTITPEGQNANQSLPVASNSIRETDSVVRVSNNQMVVIGGLMHDLRNNASAHTPFLNHIPLLSFLSKRISNNAIKSEIVILLKPTIIDLHNENKILLNTGTRIKKLSSDFHFSTKIKGN